MVHQFIYVACGRETSHYIPDSVEK